jgi:iron complex transport system substrate-binding protein
MNRRSFTISLAALLLSVAANSGAAAPTPALRVVSQTVFTDEMLLALAEPGQILALSALSRDPDFSAVSKEAAAYAQLPVSSDAEAILRHRPTLVLFADYSREELVLQVRRAGVEVMVFDKYNSLEESFLSLKRLAARLGPDAEKRAQAVEASCRLRLAVLKKQMAEVRRVRVISPSTFDIIPGDKTNFQDFCDHAGAENLAKTLGGLSGHVPAPGEKLMRWPVEKVVVIGGAADGMPSAADVEKALQPFRRMTPYRYLTAVREGRAALLPMWQSSCVSHHRVRCYEHLARQLHPEAFAKTETKRTAEPKKK